MPDFHGPIQRVTIAWTLWTIVAPSVVAVLVCAVAAVRRRSSDRLALRATLAATGLALASSVAHAASLATRPSAERFFLEHTWGLVRVGQLDASADLALDPLAATMTLVVLAVALPAVVLVGASPREGAARLLGWMNTLVASMLVLVLADGFGLLFFGWTGTALATWGIVAGAGRDAASIAAARRSFVVSRLGDATLLLAVALLYWGLGGAWTDADYAPDLSARLSAVDVRATAEPVDGATTAKSDPAASDEDEGEERTVAAPPKGTGLLTMTSYSGAVVFMDDARTPLKVDARPLVAPFTRVPVRAGVHSFRVHPGDGLDDFLVTHVPFVDGGEIALEAFGPSVTFRNVRDQLLVRDAEESTPFARALAAKRGWGAGSLVTLVSLLLFAACAIKSAQVPLSAWLGAAVARAPLPASAVVCAGSGLVAAVYLLARLSFLFALSPVAGGVAALVGLVTSLFGAATALYAYDPRRLLASVTLANVGAMILACGAGAFEVAVFQLVTAAVTTALLFLGLAAVENAIGDAAPLDLRRLGGLARRMPKTALACRLGTIAATAAPLPVFACFWSRGAIVASLVTATGVPGSMLAAALLVAFGASSFALWRSHTLVFEGPAPSAIEAAVDGSRAVTSALTTLAVGSVALGVVLGVSPALAARGGDAVLEDWLAPSLGTSSFSVGSRAALVAWVSLAAAFLAGLVGWWRARRRYLDRGERWETHERSALGHRWSHGQMGLEALEVLVVVPVVRAASGLVAEIDQRVVGGLVQFVALGARVTAWVAARLDDALVDGAVRGFGHGTERMGARVRALHTGRVQTYAAAIALGILALAFLQYWVR